MRKRALFAALALTLGAAACDNDSTEPREAPDANPSLDCTPTLGGGGGKSQDTVWICTDGTGTNGQEP